MSALIRERALEPDTGESPLIGRAKELKRCVANAAAGRHTLLVGGIGLGKSHLLRALERRLERAVFLAQPRPLRDALLALAQALHARGHLAGVGLADVPPAWGDCATHLGRVNIPALTDVVGTSLHGRGYVLCLDRLETATPSMLPTLERLLAEAVVCGATRGCRPGLEKLWWACDRIELAPLTRDESRQLLWSVADRTPLADPGMVEAKVLAQAAGNPYAVVEMARQVDEAPELTAQAIRDLHHAAGLRFLDLTPALLLVGAALIATRFVALGLDDRDLYILAGGLGALFFVVRTLLTRPGR